MADWTQQNGEIRNESDVEFKNRQLLTTDHWTNDPAPGLYDDVLRIREQKSTSASGGGSSERLYEESDRYRQQQLREPQAQHRTREIEAAELLLLDVRIWESVWSKERVQKAVVDIRTATQRNNWVDLGTNETLLNDSLAALNPDERLRADKLYREKNNIPIRAEVLGEQSGKQLAISLSLLHWPNADGFKALEFWNNWRSVFGLSDQGITALGLMNSKEINVLKEAYEDSYGGRDFETDVLNNNSAPYTPRLMSLLLEGKDSHNSEGWRDIANILTKEGKIDVFVSIMHEAPKIQRNLAERNPAVQRYIREYKNVFDAGRILDELRQ